MKLFMNWIAILLLVIIAGFGGTQARADFTISAAISLKGVLEKSQPILEKAAGEKVAFNFGASGTLAGQIKQGAPVDLFISADRLNADKLIDAKAGDKATELKIAGNELVLIFSPTSADPAPKSFADLPKVKKLVVGDPKIVPAGTYAKEVLDKLKLWDDLDKAGKIVPAENVAQVLALVKRGEVDAGIVYSTDAKAEPAVKVVATAAADTHSPIEYVSVIVTDSKKKDAAAKVQQAILSKEVQSIFGDAGFLAPAAATK
ncbi:MAG TPA: molybdate ABC transporter substrate-binding protein [Phycisphaerae bacterium]